MSKCRRTVSSTPSGRQKGKDDRDISRKKSLGHGQNGTSRCVHRHRIPSLTSVLYAETLKTKIIQTRG